MKKTSAIGGTMALFLVSAILVSAIAQATQQSHAAEILTAQSPAASIWLWSCVALATCVFGAIIYSVVAFRPSPPASSSTQARDKARELIWTLVPIAIVIAAATPALKSVAPIPSSRAAFVVANNGADHCVTLLTASTRSSVAQAISAVPCSSQR